MLYLAVSRVVRISSRISFTFIPRYDSILTLNLPSKSAAHGMPGSQQEKKKILRENPEGGWQRMLRVLEESFLPGTRVHRFETVDLDDHRIRDYQPPLREHLSWPQRFSNLLSHIEVRSFHNLPYVSLCQVLNTKLPMFALCVVTKRDTHTHTKHTDEVLACS